MPKERKKKNLPSLKKKVYIFGIRNKNTSKLFNVTKRVTPKLMQVVEIVRILWNIKEHDNLELLSTSITVFTVALYFNQEFHYEKYQPVTLNSPT